MKKITAFALVTLLSSFSAFAADEIVTCTITNGNASPMVKESHDIVVSAKEVSFPMAANGGITGNFTVTLSAFKYKPGIKTYGAYNFMVNISEINKPEVFAFSRVFTNEPVYHGQLWIFDKTMLQPDGRYSLMEFVNVDCTPKVEVQIDPIPNPAFMN
jgi:hypothetical protein